LSRLFANYDWFLLVEKRLDDVAVVLGTKQHFMAMQAPTRRLGAQRNRYWRPILVQAMAPYFKEP